MNTPRIVLFALLAAACSTPTPRPPRASVKPTVLDTHGHVRVDDYYWLRERDNPAVLAHLQAENAYTEAVMAPTESLQRELYDEFVGRVLQDDSTVPVRDGGYLYYTCTVEGRSYPIHCRRRGSMAAAEEVLLDVNAMASNHGFISVSSRTPSPDHAKLAYAVDTLGRRIYSIEVLDLATRAVTDTIPQTAGSVVWAGDGRHLFYTRRDLDTLRTYQVWRHLLGTEAVEDVLVFEETDRTFSCRIGRTRSRRFLTISSRQTLTTEVRVLSADDPTGTWRVVLPRQRGHEYRIDHWGDEWILRTNKDARNFRLVRTALDRPGPENWRDLIPHRDNVLLEGFQVFKGHLVATERSAGLRHLRVYRFSDGSDHEVEFPDPVYGVGTGPNPEFDTSILRLTYSSMTTPATVYDYDLNSRQRVLLKRDKVLGGFDTTNYQSERQWATAADGTRVPISLVYRTPFVLDGGRPLLLYGYGSYGASMDARFNPNIVSLLDRGFVYAIAHVRGGQEMGRQWYEDGKLFKKRNTFTDFIACAEHLVARGYAAQDSVCAMGGSAGGLLMGAVVNMRPDLFRAVVAAVPFVDVVTTMLDESIPLTTFEWDEWGDPRQRKYYDYMLSYSPYDQVVAQDYPDLLVTTGLHDSQVQYWEPAKWVAKLRALKTDGNRLMFKCAMEAGHGGVSGRYDRYRDQALTYAFLLSAVQ